MNDPFDSWPKARLNSFLTKVRRHVTVEPNTLYHQIGIRSHGKGVFHKEPVTGQELGDKQIYWVEPGDFILNIVFAWEGAVALISEREKGMCASHRFPTFVIDHARCDPQFLLAYFKTDIGIEQLALASPGGAGRNRTLNQSDFLDLSIPLPTLVEQRKIAEILSTWDGALDQMAQLTAAKQQRKLGLMQQLLTGRRRFAEFSKEAWDRTRLGDLLVESRVPGTNGTVARKITVRLHGKGVVPKEEKRLGSEATKYYVRQAGQLIYSTLDFLNGAFGIIPAAMDGYESTTDLPCFDFKPGIDPRFLLYFVSREAFYSRFAVSALGGRKARRIPVEEFLATEIVIPTLTEQRRIAAVLQACDDEIALLERKRDLIRQQKQGLLQQLLTGRVRVAVDQIVP